MEKPILPIVTYPAPILAKKASIVKEFDKNLETLAQNMLNTMYHAPGIGLAAPQVGISLRLFVLDVDYTKKKVTVNSEEQTILENKNPQIFVNPVLILSSDKVETEEGCLSLPGINEMVLRSNTLTINFQDTSGNHKSLDADDLLAICIQHEFDHLEGKVFLDRLSFLKKNMLRKQLLKEKKSNV